MSEIRRRKRTAPERIAAGERVSVSFVADAETYNAIVAACEQTGWSVGQVIAEALSERFNDERPMNPLQSAVMAAVERAFARRDAVAEPIGSPPPAYAQ